MYPIKIEEDYITRNLLDVKERLPFDLGMDVTYRQLSLFDDMGVSGIGSAPLKNIQQG